MIVQANILDNNGFIIEPVVVFVYDVLQVNVVKEVVPEGLYIPKWNYETLQWSEGATEEQIKKIVDEQATAESFNEGVIASLLAENKRLRESTEMQGMAILELAEMMLM